MTESAERPVRSLCPVFAVIGQHSPITGRYVAKTPERQLFFAPFGRHWEDRERAPYQGIEFNERRNMLVQNDIELTKFREEHLRCVIIRKVIREYQ